MRGVIPVSRLKNLEKAEAVEKLSRSATSYAISSLVFSRIFAS